MKNGPLQIQLTQWMSVHMPDLLDDHWFCTGSDLDCALCAWPASERLSLSLLSLLLSLWPMSLLLSSIRLPQYSKAFVSDYSYVKPVLVHETKRIAYKIILYLNSNLNSTLVSACKIRGTLTVCKQRTGMCTDVDSLCRRTNLLSALCKTRCWGVA